IEDPATVWHLGPQRYRSIAERYRALTPHHDKLAIDLNIVDRYQNVYPTKQQTGTELFQLVHQAAANFPRVPLYFHSQLLPPALYATAIEFSSQSASRAIPLLDRPPKSIQIDGADAPLSQPSSLLLPRGQHVITITTNSAK